MRAFPTLAFAAFVGLASAIDPSSIIDKLPDCAKSCVENGLPKDCGSNTSCICKSDSFVKGTTCCVKSACNAKDASSVMSLAKGLCTDFPTSVSCASTASTTSEPSQTGNSAPDNTQESEVSTNGAFVTNAPKVNALALMGAAMYFV